MSNSYPESLIGIDPKWWFLKVISLEEIMFFNGDRKRCSVRDNFHNLVDTKPLIRYVFSKLGLYFIEEDYSLPLINTRLLDFFSSFIALTSEEKIFSTNIDTGRGVRFSASEGITHNDVASVCTILNITKKKYYTMKHAITRKITPNTVIFININDPLQVINPKFIPRFPSMI